MKEIQPGSDPSIAVERAFKANTESLPYKMDGLGYDDRFANVVQKMFGVPTVSHAIEALQKAGTTPRVLDIGSGTGEYVRYWDESSSPVEFHTLDAHDYVIYPPRRATQRIGDAQKIESYYPEQYFHAILLSNVAIFLGDPLNTVFRQGVKLLRKDGGFLVANRVPLYDVLKSVRDVSLLIHRYKEAGCVFIKRGEAFDIGIRNSDTLPQPDFRFIGNRGATVSPGGVVALRHIYNVYTF